MAEWGRTSPKTLNKIFKLIEETMRNPFSVLGKPEPLNIILKAIVQEELTKNIDLFTKLKTQKLLLCPIKIIINEPK